MFGSFHHLQTAAATAAAAAAAATQPLKASTAIEPGDDAQPPESTLEQFSPFCRKPKRAFKM
jgi:hypothetical protein